MDNHRENPGLVYTIDWCKSPAPEQQLHPRCAFRLGIVFFTEGFHNGPDDRMLVEEAYGNYTDCHACQGELRYRTTALQWRHGTSFAVA